MLIVTQLRVSQREHNGNPKRVNCHCKKHQQFSAKKCSGKVICLYNLRDNIILVVSNLSFVNKRESSNLIETKMPINRISYAPQKRQKSASNLESNFYSMVVFLKRHFTRMGWNPQGETNAYTTCMHPGRSTSNCFHFSQNS